MQVISSYVYSLMMFLIGESAFSLIQPCHVRGTGTFPEYICESPRNRYRGFRSDLGSISASTLDSFMSFSLACFTIAIQPTYETL